MIWGWTDEKHPKHRVTVTLNWTLVWFDAHSALSVCPDVISIEKTGEHFRLIYDVKGRFTVHRITAEEAKVRWVTFNNCLQPHSFYAHFPGPCRIFANLSRCCLFEMDVRSLKSAIISCHWRCFRTIFKAQSLRNVVVVIRTIGSTVLAPTLELATSHAAVAEGNGHCQHCSVLVLHLYSTSCAKSRRLSLAPKESPTWWPTTPAPSATQTPTLRSMIQFASTWTTARSQTSSSLTAVGFLTGRRRQCVIRMKAF